MSERGADEIERKLAADRAAMDATLGEIQARLSPDRIVDQVLTHVRSNGNEIASSFRDSFRANPWPAVVTCVGLTWLIAAAQSGARQSGARRQNGSTRVGETNTHAETVERVQAATAAVERKAGEAESAFQERLTEAKATALSLKREATETAERFTERVEGALKQAQEAASDFSARAGAAWERGQTFVREQSEHLRDGAHKVQKGASELQGQARRAYEAQPLAIGALGIAVGTVLGALFPTTRREDELLGPANVRARQVAEDVASSALRRGEQAVDEVVNDVKDTVASEAAKLSDGDRPREDRHAAS